MIPAVSGVVHRDSGPKSARMKAKETLSGMKVQDGMCCLQGSPQYTCLEGWQSALCPPCHHVDSLTLQTYHVLHSCVHPYHPPSPVLFVNLSFSNCLQLRSRKPGGNCGRLPFLIFATVLPALKAPFPSQARAPSRCLAWMEAAAAGGAERGWLPTLPLLGSVGKLGHCGAHVRKGSGLGKARGWHVAPPRYTCGFGGGREGTWRLPKTLGFKPSPLHKLLTVMGGEGCSAAALV